MPSSGSSDPVVRRRLLISYLSLTLFVVLALALPLGLSFQNNERRRLTGQVQSEAYVFALRVNAALGESAPPQELAKLAQTFREQTGLSVVLTDGAGTVLASRGPSEAEVGTSLVGRRDIATALRGRQVTIERDARSERCALDRGTGPREREPRRCAARHVTARLRR